MNDNNILAVVLAGGKSRRFGEDKNHAKLDGVTLLDHVLKKVSKEFDQILVISNEKIKTNYSPSIIVVPDCIKGGLGPLAGVLTSMRWIKEKKMKYKWIATFPSDTPFFDISIIEKYKEKINKSESLLYFIKSNHKRHNIFGLWSINLLDRLEDDLINNGHRKVEKWANKIGVETIEINNNKFDYFLNINTKNDLVEAQKILKNFKDD
jgi:molybdenum cofactor guanylyltransferase